MVTRAQRIRGALGANRAIQALLQIAPPIPPGVSSSMVVVAAVTVSDAIEADSVRLLATAACNIVIAGNPDVDVAALGAFLPANVPETFRIKRGYKIATKRTAGDGVLNITIPAETDTPYIALSSEASVSEATQIGSLARTARVVGLPGNFVFTMDDPSGKLTMAGAAGVTSLISLAALLDFETAPTLDFSISATNGVDTVTTEFSLVVGDIGVPVNTVAPTVTGTAQVGETLTKATNGTWTSAVAAVYTFKWYANDVLIPGATLATYVVQLAYLGQTIKVGVTATTPEGAVEAKSAATAAVIAA